LTDGGVCSEGNETVGQEGTHTCLDGVTRIVVGIESEIGLALNTDIDIISIPISETVVESRESLSNVVGIGD